MRAGNARRAKRLGGGGEQGRAQVRVWPGREKDKEEKRGRANEERKGKPGAEEEPGGGEGGAGGGPGGGRREPSRRSGATGGRLGREAGKGRDGKRAAEGECWE